MHLLRELAAYFFDIIARDVISVSLSHTFNA